jgi:Ran GTPase-activating protein (RanGAP) involved in mRNA processing and transport
MHQLASIWTNRIGAAGAENLARVLGQCAALAHLNLTGNDIEAVGGGRLGDSCGVIKPLTIYCAISNLAA